MLDKMRIQQIILNLLSNAIKFSPDESEIKVIVATKIEDTETMSVSI